MLLPVKVYSALEHQFLYFPEAHIYATPANLNLDYEEVTFPAEDGTSLHGWYLPGRPELPALVFCHGNAGNISHRLDNLKRFHSLGLTVFIFDYRGYGLSAGKSSEDGTYSDGRGALRFLQQKGWSPDRLIYFGRSLGAAVALQLALEIPPAALVLESPFTSVSAMGRHHYPLLFLLAGWLLDARYDNQAKIGGLQAPLLLLHGERDNIVPISMGQNLFTLAPEPKVFYRIPGAGHNNTYDLGGEDYWLAWRDFLERYTDFRE